MASNLNTKVIHHSGDLAGDVKNMGAGSLAFRVNTTGKHNVTCNANNWNGGSVQLKDTDGTVRFNSSGGQSGSVQLTAGTGAIWVVTGNPIGLHVHVEDPST